VIKSSIKLFADDTKVWKVVKNADDIRKLQEDLNTLDQWSEKLLLHFNIEKCIVMHIGKNTESHYYLTNNGIKKKSK